MDGALLGEQQIEGEWVILQHRVPKTMYVASA